MHVYQNTLRATWKQSLRARDFALKEKASIRLAALGCVRCPRAFSWAPNGDGLPGSCDVDVQGLPVSLRRSFENLHVQSLVSYQL